jgi:hypothetical protein
MDDIEKSQREFMDSFADAEPIVPVSVMYAAGAFLCGLFMGAWLL